MAQQFDGPLSDRTHRTVEQDLNLADAGRERVSYAQCQLTGRLERIMQESARLYQQIINGTIRERQAAEQLAEIEDLSDDLSTGGEMLAQGARDRDVHRNDAVDRGLERAVNESPPEVPDETDFDTVAEEGNDG